MTPIRSLGRGIALCSLCLVASYGAEIHVAPDGDDTSTDPSRRDSALQTIGAAASRAAAGDTVTIHGGVYHETVRPANSGTGEDQRIVFRGATGETVVVSGADPVAAIAASGASWRQEGNSAIWSIALDGAYDSDLGYHDQCFVDGAMLDLARHPSVPNGDRMQPGPGGWFYFESHSDKVDADEYDGWPSGRASEITFTSSQLTEDSGYWDDATIWIAPSENQSWQFGFIGPVLDFTRTANGGRVRATIYTETGSFFHLHDHSTRFYLFNCQAALDAPGEWYLDPNTNRLYVWLPGDADPNAHEVSMRRRDLAFDLDRRSHISIENLDIFAATISTDAELGDGDVYGHAANNGGRARGTIAEAEHIVIDGIDARYVSHFNGTTGWYQSQWYDISGILLSGSHHRIRNSSIMYSAGNGVMLRGRGSRVSNCFISDTQYVLARGGGVCMPTKSAWEMEVDHTTIVRSGWTGVDSDECQVDFHHNFVDAFAIMGHDTGGTHFVGSGWAESDIRIRHNLFRGGLGFDVQGIYFDFCDQYSILNNIVLYATNGINLNGSFGGDCINNSLVTFDGGIGGRWNSGGGMVNTRIINNIANHNVDDRHRDGVSGFVYQTNLKNVDPDEHFVDWRNGDFSLRSASGAVDAGTEVSGITTGAVGAPDIGASERGADDEQWWTAVGCSDAVIPVKSPGRLTLDLRPGYGVLSWEDRAENESGYLIERSWHVQATGDKQIKGKDFTVIGRVGPNVTSFVDDDMPIHEENNLYYRVRAVGSAYSTMVARPAGFMGDRRVGFEPIEGYVSGNLDGQSSWRGHYPAWATPFEPQQPTGIVVAEDGAGGHRAEFRSGNGLQLNYYGDLAAHDRDFDPTSSRTEISFRIGLKATRSGDGDTALHIGLGGPDYSSHWQGPQPRMMDLYLTRGGSLKLGGSTIGSIAAQGSEIRIVLDWAAQRYDIELDGTAVASNRGFDREKDLSKVLLMVSGSPYDDAHAAWLDDINFAPEDTQDPALAIAFLDGEADEGETVGLLVSSDFRPDEDLAITLDVSSLGQATAADVILRDGQGQIIDAVDGTYPITLPQDTRHVRLTCQVLADGLAESTERLVFAVQDGTGFVADDDLSQTSLLIRAPDGRRIRADVVPTRAIEARLDGGTPQALPLDVEGLDPTTDHAVTFEAIEGTG